MTIQDILVKFKPLSGQVLDMGIAAAVSNKAAVIGAVDTEANSLESQADSAINAALKKEGGVVELFAGELEGVLEPLLAKEVTAGETDLSALYDKGVGYLQAEAKTLGG